jgi:hypothetical protein
VRAGVVSEMDASDELARHRDAPAEGPAGDVDARQPKQRLGEPTPPIRTPDVGPPLVFQAQVVCVRRHIGIRRAQGRRRVVDVGQVGQPRARQVSVGDDVHRSGRLSLRWRELSLRVVLAHDVPAEHPSRVARVRLERARVAGAVEGLPELQDDAALGLHDPGIVIGGPEEAQEGALDAGTEVLPAGGP